MVYTDPYSSTFIDYSSTKRENIYEKYCVTVDIYNEGNNGQNMVSKKDKMMFEFFLESFKEALSNGKGNAIEAKKAVQHTTRQLFF